MGIRKYRIDDKTGQVELPANASLYPDAEELNKYMPAYASKNASCISNDMAGTWIWLSDGKTIDGINPIHVCDPSDNATIQDLEFIAFLSEDFDKEQEMQNTKLVMSFNDSSVIECINDLPVFKKNVNVRVVNLYDFSYLDFELHRETTSSDFEVVDYDSDHRSILMNETVRFIYAKNSDLIQYELYVYVKNMNFFDSYENEAKKEDEDSVPDCVFDEHGNAFNLIDDEMHVFNKDIDKVKIGDIVFLKSSDNSKKTIFIADSLSKDMFVKNRYKFISLDGIYYRIDNEDDSLQFIWSMRSQNALR